MSTNQAQTAPSPSSSAGPIVQQVSTMQSDEQQPSAAQQPTPTKQPRKRIWMGFAGKTLWDWLNLLAVLLVPLMIGVFTIAISVQQNQISQSQHDSDQHIATDQQQTATLKAYLDDMTDLLLNHGLRQAKSNDEVSIIARAKTLATVRGLDGDRKGALLQFLYEARLIGGGTGVQTYPPLISLDGADLSGTNLQLADLSGASLQGANLADASLEGTKLQQAQLQQAVLGNAQLGGVDLQGANLQDTTLNGADLEQAILKDANVAPYQLAVASSLKYATLPDGSKYPSQSYPIPNTH